MFAFQTSVFFFFLKDFGHFAKTWRELIILTLRVLISLALCVNYKKSKHFMHICLVLNGFLVFLVFFFVCLCFCVRFCEWQQNSQRPKKSHKTKLNAKEHKGWQYNEKNGFRHCRYSFIQRQNLMEQTQTNPIPHCTYLMFFFYFFLLFFCFFVSSSISVSKKAKNHATYLYCEIAQKKNWTKQTETEFVAILCFCDTVSVHKLNWKPWNQGICLRFFFFGVIFLFFVLQRLGTNKRQPVKAKHKKHVHTRINRNLDG